MNSTNIRELKHNIGHQKNVIVQQRNQIQKFAKEMNTLKSKLIALNQFKEKIRIIADIDLPHRQDSFFGVGGSIPEDFSTHSPLTKEPDELVREMETNLRLCAIHQKWLDQSALGKGPGSKQKSLGHTKCNTTISLKNDGPTKM